MKIYVPLSLCLLPACLASPIPGTSEKQNLGKGVDGPLGLPASIQIRPQQFKHLGHDADFQQHSSLASGVGPVFNYGTQPPKPFGNNRFTGGSGNVVGYINTPFNQGTGSLSQPGNFGQAAKLAGIGNFFQTNSFPGLAGAVAPGIPGTSPHQTGIVPISPFATGSSAVNFQQGSSSSGQSQGESAWSHNQGQSAVNSSGHKETFTNKESFGDESSTSHALGAAQNANAQSSQAGHYDRGQSVEAVSQGINAAGSPLVPPVAGLPAAQLGGSDTTIPPGPATTQLLALSSGSSPALAGTPSLLQTQLPQLPNVPGLSSIRGERYSTGSLENAQTSGNNSTAYNQGSTKSTSYSTKESSHDKKSFGDADGDSHSQAHQQGSNSEQVSGSRFQQEDREQHTAVIGS